MCKRFCIGSLLLMFVTGASAATITISIVSGTIINVPGSSMGGRGTFDLVTTTGTITGTAPIDESGLWFNGSYAPMNHDLVAYFSECCFPANLQLTGPGTINFITYGSGRGDFIWGQMTSPVLTFNYDLETYVGSFTGELHLQKTNEYFDTDAYVFPGSGTVTVDLGGSLGIAKETFTFTSIPEPSTGILCLVALLCAAGLSRAIAYFRTRFISA